MKKEDTIQVRKNIFSNDNLMESSLIYNSNWSKSEEIEKQKAGISPITINEANRK